MSDNEISNNNNITNIDKDKNFNDTLNNIFGKFINNNIDSSNKLLFLKEIIFTLNKLLKSDDLNAGNFIDNKIINEHKGSDYPIYPLPYCNPEEFYSDIYNYPIKYFLNKIYLIFKWI